jgi:lysophospholipase L1-like esterase
VRSARACVFAALIAPAALLAQPAEAPAERTDAPKLEPYKIILVGDSTMAPNSGWGGAFCAHHVKWKIACLNLARGARSTRSFRSEGGWDLALAEMEVPGYARVYVLIQMGHNDQARQKPERWTEEATEYPDNLRRFVKEARAAGAVPVLITPLARREFVGGRLNNTLASWSEQVRKVARELQAPLIDLNARSAELVQKLGPVPSLDFAQRAPSPEEKAAAAKGTTLPPPPSLPAAVDDSAESAGRKTGTRGRASLKFDYTHLGPKGAETFAAMVAEDLGAAVPELGGVLIHRAPD